MVKKNNRQKGQALLIVVLVMVVALTVGLAVISRSITSLRTSTEQANSQQALSAAEAGIARSLKTGKAVPFGASLSNNTTYETTVSPVKGGSFLLNEGLPVSKDEGIDVWLVGHDASGNPDYSSQWGGTLTIYWGDSSGNSCGPPPTAAALEIVVVSGSRLSPASTRYAYDPCFTRRGNNNFTNPATGHFMSGKFSYSTSTSPIIINGGFVVRVIPLYANALLGVDGNGNALPSQGSNISSTGQAGGTVRKINVFQGYPLLPAAFFTSGIFSPI